MIPVPVHVPERHVSPLVQPLPSLHAVPSAFVGVEHVPVVGLQIPASWHWSWALQTTGLLPVQAPARQVSVWVQPLPSLHEVPFAACGFEHEPVAGSQMPGTWHWSLATQTTAAPVQVPDWQVSAVVQALPSLQSVPLGAVGVEQMPVAGLHVPAT
jgi:hypothetical protein